MIELAVAIGLGIGVAAMIGGIAASGMTRLQSLARFGRLNANATLFQSQLSYYVRQAKEIQVASPSVIKFILLPPGAQTSTVMTIATSGTAIVVDGAPITTTEVRVTELSFTKLPRSVRYHVTMKAQNDILSVTSTVAQRNSF